MKKIIYASTVILLILGIFSCGTNSAPKVKSYVFDMYSSDWSSNGTYGTDNYSYIAAHNISDITSDVVNNGTVLGYIGNSSGWFALPYTLTFSTWSTNINYAYVVGGVGFECKDTDLHSTAPSGTLTFKMVILTQKDMHLIDNVDINNYYEVSEALNLDK